MVLALLESKYRLPAQPRQMVMRPRLVADLEQGIKEYRLALISAPAGYGKTTLLAEWARATRLPVAWLSVGKEENDVEQFLRYLLAAWETVQPEIVNTPLGILLGSHMTESEVVLAHFINATYQMPDHLVFVLDDYHLVENHDVHEALTYILDHLPEHGHFILSSRHEPPLPIARYRARGQLLEIGAKELSFTPEEAKDFLRRANALELSTDETTSLYRHTEGWIAGLQLTALALRRGQYDTEGRLPLSGRQRFIADYLRESILKQLPGEMNDFILQTSILEQLCGSLCNAVTGEENGQVMLETLERENLFLIPLDDRREWFRYHALFEDFLRGELLQRTPDIVNDLHRQAAKWYAAHGLEEQALHHAMAGEDSSLTAKIAESYVHRMVLSGKLKKLQSWLNSIPSDWYAEYPIFGIARASIFIFTGAFDAFARNLDTVERNLEATEREDLPWQLAKLTALRCAMACFQNDLEQAEAYAEQALDGLPEKDYTYRAVIYHALGDTYRRIGRWQQARDCYLKVFGFSADPTYQVRSVHVFGALADLDLRQGHLRDAAANWRRALREIPEQKAVGSLPLPVIGWVYIRMAEILYEWNQLAETRLQVSRGLKHAELGGDVQAMTAGYLIAAKLELAGGDLGEAAELLEQSRSLVAKNQLAQWTSQYERLQLELWLAQDRPWAVADWLEERSSEALFADQSKNIASQLVIARALILKKDQPSLKKALHRLDVLLQVAKSEGRMGVMIEVHALRALAFWVQEDQTEALTALEQALRIAEPEGYVRLFVDLGLPMGRLLQEALARQVRPDYIKTLLAAFDVEDKFSSVAQTALPKPLTPRELEILALIASGLTNREIAEKLVVSPETVKKHTGNIYGKLGVSSRTQAVARARELDMLA